MPRHRLLILLAVQAAAFWPVWRWVAARVGDGSGEGAALLACAAALLLPPTTSRGANGDTASLVLPTLATLVYAASVPFAPPVLRAACAFCALLATWSAWRWGAPPHPAAWGLAMLALPVLPTAQFVLGFPLRVATGELAAALLGFGGLAVERDGVALTWGHRLVTIDAPCSGVHMLWTALLLACVLGVAGHLSRPRTALLILAAGSLAVAGNALRAASLFLVEVGLLPLPPAGHTGVGLVCFALALTPLLLLFGRWQRPAATCAPPSPS